MVGKQTIVSSPNIVVFYEQGQQYFRRPIAHEADNCEFFHFWPSLVEPLVDDYDPRLADSGAALFRRTYGPIGSQWLLLERQLVDYVESTDEPDCWWVDETMQLLLHGILADNYPLPSVKRHLRSRTLKQHRTLVRETKRLLIERLSERLTLKQLAQTLYISPYHLSRVFHQQTGMTLLHYSEQLRLRLAYDRLHEYRSDLTALAHDVGYKNHSHFTYAFKKAFGTPPSQIQLVRQVVLQ